jgi:hypothetical protein
VVGAGEPGGDGAALEVLERPHRPVLNLLTENLVATGADTFGLSGGSDSVFAARDKGLPVVTRFSVSRFGPPGLIVRSSPSAL